MIYNKVKTIEMLGKNVLLKPYVPTEVNGIILTQTQNYPKMYNFIIAVGRDVYDKENIKSGNICIIPRHTGHWVELNGEKYIQVVEDDILAIFEGEVSEE